MYSVVLSCLQYLITEWYSGVILIGYLNHLVSEIIIYCKRSSTYTPRESSSFEMIVNGEGGPGLCIKTASFSPSTFPFNLNCMQDAQTLPWIWLSIPQPGHFLDFGINVLVPAWETPLLSFLIFFQTWRRTRLLFSSLPASSGVKRLINSKVEAASILPWVNCSALVSCCAGSGYLFLSSCYFAPVAYYLWTLLFEGSKTVEPRQLGRYADRSEVGIFWSFRFA